MIAKGKHEKQTLTGIGGAVERTATSVAPVEFFIESKSVTLKPAFVLDDVSLDSARWAAGNLGIDLLNQATSVMIDFRSMHLSLD